MPATAKGEKVADAVSLSDRLSSSFSPSRTYTSRRPPRLSALFTWTGVPSQVRSAAGFPGPLKYKTEQVVSSNAWIKSGNNIELAF